MLLKYPSPLQNDHFTKETSMIQRQVSEHERMAFLDEHFHYEVFMLGYSLKKIIDSKRPSNRNDEALALEGFLLHARNLNEFYYYQSSRKDYARATDYIDKLIWEKVRPKKTSEIKEQEIRINHELSHLTYNRIAGDGVEKQWDCGRLYNDYIMVTKCFLDNLPDKFFGDKLKGLKAELSANTSPFNRNNMPHGLSVATDISTPSLSDTACSTFPTI